MVAIKLGKIVHIPTSKLNFDPDNPRFYRLNDVHNVASVIEEMLDDEGAEDLMLSIGQKGYFEGEPLLIVDVDGDYIVVEGNRRLSAVKLLNGEIAPPIRRQKSIAKTISEALIPPPTELPCLIYPSRKDVLKYLGYRHITGIKQWDSLSKAKYLAELRATFYTSGSLEEQMLGLSKEIGSRSDYVAKLLTALALYSRAEDEKFFGLPVTDKDVEFSYITTAIGYSSITDWLGLEDSKDINMVNLNADNLKKSFSWMFSKDQQGRTILGESRRLKDLAAIIKYDAAIKVLEDTGDLSEAYLYSDGPEEALRKAFNEALTRVNVVWNMLPKSSLDMDNLQSSESLAEKSRDIRNHIRGKLED